MGLSVHDGNLQVNGTLSATSMTLPTGVVTKEKIASAAGIEATKYIQRQRIVYVDGEYDDAPTPVNKILHVITGATGSVKQFKAGMASAPSSGSINVDLRKNGVSGGDSILSAAINISSSQSDGDMVAGTVQSMSVAVDDILYIVVTDNTSAGCAGLVAVAVIDEDPV